MGADDRAVQTAACIGSVFSGCDAGSPAGRRSPSGNHRRTRPQSKRMRGQSAGSAGGSGADGAADLELKREASGPTTSLAMSGAAMEEKAQPAPPVRGPNEESDPNRRHGGHTAGHTRKSLDARCASDAGRTYGACGHHRHLLGRRRRLHRRGRPRLRLQRHHPASAKPARPAAAPMP